MIPGENEGGGAAGASDPSGKGGTPMTGTAPAAAAAASNGSDDATREPVPVYPPELDRTAHDLAELDKELRQHGHSLASVLRQIAKQIVGPF